MPTISLDPQETLSGQPQPVSPGPAGHQPTPQLCPLDPARWPYCVIHIFENLLGLLKVTALLHALPLQVAGSELLQEGVGTFVDP